MRNDCSDALRFELVDNTTARWRESVFTNFFFLLGEKPGSFEVTLNATRLEGRNDSNVDSDVEFGVY